MRAYGKADIRKAVVAPTGGFGGFGIGAGRVDRARRPLVGIFPRVEERVNGKGLACVTQLCLTLGLQRAGAACATMSPSFDPAALLGYVDAFDAFVVPGGCDVDPSRYGAAREAACGAEEPFREDFELALLPLILASDKPLICICHGSQLLNVAMGGTLWQDIPTDPGSTPVKLANPIEHCSKPPYDARHGVSVATGSLLERIMVGRLGRGAPLELAVNSMHHQCVRELGSGLAVCAQAPDGVVEGFEVVGKRFALALQWHPEMMWESDPVSAAIFDAVVRAAAGL